MPEKKVHQPHDRLIKFTYGRKESAIAFFQSYLPPTLIADLDLSTLELRPGSFVDPTLSDRHTDLLYQIDLQGTPLFLYCLFEHQSTPDSWMAHRLLDYQSAIWRQYRKENPKSQQAPPIYPLVLYSGKEPWRAPLRWIEKLAVPRESAAELVRSQVDFGYHLVDLSALSAEEIRGDIAGRLTLSLMKAAAENRILEWLDQAGPLLKLLQQPEVTGMFEVLLRYVLAVDTTLTRENLLGAVERLIVPELTDQAMSIADQLIEEGVLKGRALGRKEGRKEGRLEGEIRILQELLGVPQSNLNDLATLSNAELERLAKELKARFLQR